MMRTLLRSICLGALGIGAMVELTGPPLPASDVRASIARPAPARSAFGVGDRFQIDVTLVRQEFDTLSVDERSEQVADWAVWGTALYAGLSADSVRGALFDRPPVRLPFLSEALTFDYGPGRSLVVGEGEVWIFRHENDPHPDATVGRLADRVRMELGQPPEQATIFAFRSELVDGTVEVRTVERISGAELFTPRFGWFEGVVETAADLAQWLGRVDDVTHVRLADGQVVLGGRRFDDARTPAVSVEDVATLYQSQVELAEKRRKLEEDLERPSELFNALVTEFNEGGERFTPDFFARIGAVERLLEGGYEILPPVSSSSGTDTPDHRQGTRLAASQALSSLRSKVEAAANPKSPWWRHVLARHERVPDGLGFSLDPVWNLAGIANDLRMLLTDHQTLIKMARRAATVASPEAGQTALRGRALHLVKLVDLVRRRGDRPIPTLHPKRLEDLVSALGGATARQQEQAQALVPFFRLLEDLKNPASIEDVLLRAHLKFVEARNQRQCARYDGGIRGTRVGMNLFYTDLLAKVWASVDYYNSAPSDEVHGFLSEPRIGETIDATYLDEVLARPTTRLWFGVRPEAYALTEKEDALNFAHVATRVYSAGSNPLAPEVEGRPSEPDRQVFGWWDRHFDRVADHEPEYHLQNQFMKWSAITGWLAKNQSMGFLASVKASASVGRRFPEWYEGRKGLRFRRNVHFSTGFRADDTECLEILRSYDFDMAGESFHIEGGVSLGSLRSIEVGTKVSSKIPAVVRRGGLVRNSTGRALQTWKGTKFELYAPRALQEASWAVRPARDAVMRTRGVDLRISKLENSVAVSDMGGEVHLSTGHGVVGTLQVARTPNGVRLSWTRGPLEDARRVAQEVGRSGLRHETLGRIAGDAGPVGRQPVYLVEKSSGGEMVAIWSGGRRRIDGAGSALRLAAAPSNRPGATLRVGLPSSSPMRPGLVPSRHAYGDIVPVNRALAEVDQAPWQKLTHLDEPGPSGRRDILRVFTHREPGAGARPVEIRLSTGDVLHGKVEGNALYLRRPADGRVARTFNELMEHETITADFLKRAMAGSREPLPPLAARSRGARAADKLVSDELDRAIDELAGAGADLDRTLAEFQTEALRGGWTRPATADARRITALLPSAKKGATSADESLLRALADIEARDVKGAVERVQDAISSPPTRGRLQEIAVHLDEAGPDGKEIGVYLRARDGQMPGFSAEMAKDVQLEVHGHAIQSVAPLKGTTKLVSGEKTKASLISEATRGEVVVYSEVSPHLVRYDWDAMPAKSLHKAAVDPAVRWELVDAPSLGSFRPTRFVNQDRQFVRRDLGLAPEAVSHATAPKILLLRPMAISLHPNRCNPNQDGAARSSQPDCSPN